MRAFYWALVFAAAVLPLQAQEPAEEGIRAMREKIEASFKQAEAADSLEPVMVAFGEADAELGVFFEMKYGVKPQDTREWPGFLEAAKTWLKQLKTLADKEQQPYFNLDSANVASCMALTWTGKADKALKLLDQQEAGGDCGNWVSTVELEKGRQRSHIYRLQGDEAKALKALNDVIPELRLAFYTQEDLLFTEHAFLLEKNGKTQSAVDEYQMVVDLYPKTEGAGLSQKALIRLKAFKEPTGDRLMKRYLDPETEGDRFKLAEVHFFEETVTPIRKSATPPPPMKLHLKPGTEGGYFQAAAIRALAVHRFPESYAMLAELLDKDVSLTGFCVEALTNLKDPRAIPLLRQAYEARKEADLSLALALVQLGDKSKLLAYLEDYKSHGEYPSLTDHWLRDAFGGGPDVKIDDKMEPKAMADAWIAWLQTWKPAAS